MKIFNKKLLLILLIILVIFSFMFNKKEDKVVVLDDVKVISNNDKFAIKYEKTDGVYEEYTGNDFPKGYVLNIKDSKCFDNEDNELENILSFANNSVTITSSITNYCYLTFDKSAGLKIIESKPDNLNGNQAGMYRYQGSNDVVNNNYICFGTDDVDACRENEDKYMYRIIGITDDGKLELIKKTALTRNGVQWHSVYRSEWKYKEEVTEENKNEKKIDADIPWSESDLFKRLNGLSNKNDNLFVGNNTYDYMNKDSDWYNKIADTEWLSGQLLWDNISFQISKIYNIETGKEIALHYEEANPYYYNGGTDTVSQDDTYTTRRQQDSVTCERYDNTSINKVTCYKTITGKTFDDKVTAKIGLMHVYDYDYAVQQNGLNCFYDNVYDRSNGTDKPKTELTTCKNSWIHISNNDTTIFTASGGVHDWTLSRYGFYPYLDNFVAWGVDSTGRVFNYGVNSSLSARPVFYLENTITIKEDTNGTIENPYIIN